MMSFRPILDTLEDRRVPIATVAGQVVAAPVVWNSDPNGDPYVGFVSTAQPTIVNSDPNIFDSSPVAGDGPDLGFGDPTSDPTGGYDTPFVGF